MPDNGVRTIDLTNLASAEDLLAHDGGTLGMLPLASLSTRLAASGALADRFTAVETATSYASLLRPSWAALAELAPSGIGQRAEVADSDTGSHTDPQSSETVDNAGQYTAFGTGVGDWTWLQPTGLSGKLTSAANLSDVADPDVARGNLGAPSQGEVAAAAATAQAAAITATGVDARTAGVLGGDGETILVPADAALAGIEELAFALSDGAGNLGLGLSPQGEVILRQLLTLGSLRGKGYEVIGEETSHAFALADGSDRVGFAVTTRGELLVGGGAQIGGKAADWDFAVIDANDHVGFGFKDGTFHFPGIGAETWADLDLRNKAWSQAMIQRAPMVQLATATYNTLMNYGQSLGEGNETWPSLSKTPQPGALMVGDNVDNLTAASYTAMGTAQFNPLVANTHDGTANLSGAEEAALTPGDQVNGEPPVIGLTNGLKLWLNRRGLSENDGRNLVAMSSAQAGRTIAQLSKVNTQDGLDRWGGMLDGIQLAKDLADALSETCVCPIMTWLQGEWDYTTSNGSTNATRALYAAALHTLFDDANTDIMAITGQALPPLKLVYQTGASYTRDVDANGDPDLHVGMAQLEVVLARDDAVMVGPIYPYTDKGAHLDANGARWFGCQMAKVAAKVMAGQAFQPVRPLQVTASGTAITVSYHVPVPPLRFASPRVVLAAATYADRGFRVTSADGLTTYPITSVEIVADTVIRIVTTTPPPADALLWYADKTVHNGNGMVFDSDPTLAPELYDYVPERGMYAGANIPELVGKRYPLHNPSIAFVLPLSYSEC
ncbi:hypothetical protein K7H20_18305 [Salipiger manganoxidans]|uniref:hypothetical protein n=1 Tax=Salipiger marinus TaxID=555512 RepID=UPI001E581BCC|nr:hypothetical protein [Salipiger manganoxidans]MCD1620013.1 hypothetical protein [Salipiger manganoxidans]